MNDENEFSKLRCDTFNKISDSISDLHNHIISTSNITTTSTNALGLYNTSQSNLGNIGSNTHIQSPSFSGYWYTEDTIPTKEEAKKELLESMLEKLASNLSSVNKELEELIKDDLGIYRINLEGYKRGILAMIKFVNDSLK